MLPKVPAAWWTVIGVLCAGFLAPVGVRHSGDAGRETPPAGAIPAVLSAAPLSEAPPPAARVRAKGTGPTPAAAFQRALDAAQHEAIAAEVSGADWGRHGPAYRAALRRNGAGVVRGWQEVSSGSERRLTGRVYQSEVEVEFDVNVLRERLRAVGPVTLR